MALDEYELAVRWAISAKTLRRWRQMQLGPLFIKLGGRVSYLLTDVQDYERRALRNATFSKVHPEGGQHA